MTLAKYIGSLIGCVLAVGIIAGLVLWFVLPQYYFGFYPFMGLIFIIMGLPFYNVLKNKGVAEQRKFANMFMANTFFKLFLSLIVILLYVYFIKVQTIAFVVVFFVFYMALSMFEIWTFARLPKKENNVA